MPKQDLIRRLLRFAVVGGSVMLLFTGLNLLFGKWVGERTAFILAYPPAVLLHFCLNKWWTFGSEGAATAKQISEYLVMVGVTFLIQCLLFWLGHDVLHVVGWLAAAGANAGQMVLSFLIMQRRVFASAPS